MKPIKEGRIGGSTSSNAFTHTDYVKVNKVLTKFRVSLCILNYSIILGIWGPPRHHPG